MIEVSSRWPLGYYDIGNAVVGIGSHLTKARRSLESNDVQTLDKLLQFFEMKKDDLANALGAAKSEALNSLVVGLKENQQSLQEELSQNIKEQMGITSHISDILSIQRQYVTNSESSRRDPMDLKSVLYDALSILMASIEKRGINLKADIPENCPYFTGDRTKLIQVFINLIKNALDAIDEADREPKNLSIQLSFNDSEIVVSIEDNGIGFEPDLSEKLFERGYSTKNQGSGIGLATSRSVIESHQGTLELNSDGKNQGSKVLVKIPINKD